MPWLSLACLLFFLTPTNSKAPCCQCLPKGIQSTTVVGFGGFRPSKQKGHAITVAETLAGLKARCKRGKLVDARGREIFFFPMTGCWGNPPENYQEILDEQARKLAQLKKRYTVIEMTCNPSGEMIN